MHGSSLFWLIPFWPQSQGCQSNSKVTHVVTVNERVQRTHTDQILSWACLSWAWRVLTPEDLAFLLLGIFFIAGELLDWRETPLFYFAIWEVRVINLHRLVGNVRRRNLTIVPGKTDKVRLHQSTDKVWQELGRSEKRGKRPLTHSTQIFGFRMRAFQLLARNLCSVCSGTSDLKWVMMSEETN